METVRFNAANRPLPLDVANAMIRKYSPDARPISDSELGMFQRSLVHRSYASANATRVNAFAPEGCMLIAECSNERNEYLGDSVLALVVTSYLHERFPTQGEGFMTVMRTKIVNGIALADFARHLGLQRWLVVSKEVEEGKGRDAKDVLEDAFEAWLAAMYLTLGYDATRVWLVRFMETHVDFADTIVRQRDWKSALHTWFTATYRRAPEFRVIEQSPQFRVGVADATGSTVATGCGGTQKAAENDAARAALKYFGRL